MAGRFTRYAIGAITLAISTGTQANEPDAAAIDCLSSVLRAAPNAISVTAADNWQRAMADAVPAQTVLKGVTYTFRAADHTTMSVGVYLETEFARRSQCNGAPNCVETAMGSTFTPSDNGRYQLVLREPYPKDWYPVAAKMKSANGWSYVKRDSAHHPLYGLWDKLSAACRVDNQMLNPPSADTP